MKVIDILAQAKGTLFTFELMPPLKGESFAEIGATIETLLPYKPSYVNITNHRAEMILKERPDGLLEKHVVRKRASTVSIAAAIKYKYGVEVVPHVVCGGFSQNEIEDILIDFDFLDIHNILALRGDPVQGEKYFTPHPAGHAHALDLLHQATGMNKGKYLHTTKNNPTGFCLGVAGYPEKHSEAPNMQADLQWLKAKVDAGAEYVVTQMFFDNQRYFDFVNACRLADIHVPIIPGIKPFANHKQLSILPQVFHIDLPNDLVKEVERCKTTQDVRQVGVEWCVAQCKQLKAAGVPALHFYTMGKADNVAAIVQQVF